MSDDNNIGEKLTAPFPTESVGWKPGAVSGTRCLAMAYIDARDVMDRLDAVLGVGGWMDDYAQMEHGTIRCTLRCLIGGEWVSKQDVGGESDQKDDGDRMKSAFSDALKRAAVKFGIGRYLYRLEGMWCEYDPQKKRIVKNPELPSWALPPDEHRGKKEQTAAEVTASALMERIKSGTEETIPKLIEDVSKAKAVVGQQTYAKLREAIDAVALKLPGVGKAVEDWKDWLKGVIRTGNLGAMNAEMADDFMLLQGQARRLVWLEIRAAAAAAGWKWEPDAKVFVVDLPEGADKA